jgi:HEAT repeat protein
MGAGAERAVPALIEALADADDGVQTAVIQALHKLGAAARPAVPVLAKVLEKEKYVGVWAARAFPDIAPNDKIAHAALTKALKHESDHTRKVAAESLGRIGSRAAGAVAGLTAALMDKNGGVRVASAKALGKMGASAKDAVPALAKALREDGERWVRKAVAEALGAMGPAAAGAADALAGALSDDQVVVGSAAKSALLKLGPAAREVVPTLAKLLDAKGYPADALKVLGHLARTDAPARAALAGAASTHKGQRVRFAALHELSKLGATASDAVPAIMKALKDEDREVRRVAANALGCIGPGARGAIPALERVLANDKQTTVRSAAKSALERIEGKRRRR